MKNVEKKNEISSKTNPTASLKKIKILVQEIHLSFSDLQVLDHPKWSPNEYIISKYNTDNQMENWNKKSKNRMKLFPQKHSLYMIL